MSDSIWVEIIAAVGAVLVAIIGLIKFRKHSEPKADKPSILSNVGSISGSVINVNSPQPERSQVAPLQAQIPEDSRPEKPIQDLAEYCVRRLVELTPKPIIPETHKEICDTIETATPFHQEKIQETFIGKRVCWHTQLSGISHFKDYIIVSAKIPDGNGVLFCSASPVAGDIFITAKEGTFFKVTGEIERISRYEAFLKECSFEKIEEVRKM